MPSPNRPPTEPTAPPPPPPRLAPPSVETITLCHSLLSYPMLSWRPCLPTHTVRALPASSVRRRNVQPWLPQLSLRHLSICAMPPLVPLPPCQPAAVAVRLPASHPRCLCPACVLGQEFAALDPEAFLFGEMADLNYLSRMPGVVGLSVCSSPSSDGL